MKTLEIRAGDLALAPGGYAMLTGRAKMKQDLAVAVREPLGCDRFHPNWGSVLGEMIGGISGDDTKGRILAEINRLIFNYSAVQNDQFAGTYSSGQPLYTNDEVISAVTGIKITAREDAFYVRVSLVTMANNTVTLTTKVGL